VFPIDDRFQPFQVRGFAKSGAANQADPIPIAVVVYLVLFLRDPLRLFLHEEFATLGV
jgi:hypothetical protein